MGCRLLCQVTCTLCIESVENAEVSVVAHSISSQFYDQLMLGVDVASFDVLRPLVSPWISFQHQEISTQMADITCESGEAKEHVCRHYLLFAFPS